MTKQEISDLFDRYEDARTAGWSARYVDIYLMDKAPGS